MDAVIGLFAAFVLPLVFIAACVRIAQRLDDEKEKPR